MKGKHITWDQFKKEDPKQTVVEVVYSSPSLEKLKVPFTRVFLGGFSSREEAWEWCKRENIKRMVIYEKGEPVSIQPRLIRLGKLIRSYSEEHPARVAAIKVSL